jgi:hypothetical protein
MIFLQRPDFQYACLNVVHICQSLCSNNILSCLVACFAAVICQNAQKSRPNICIKTPARDICSEQNATKCARQNVKTYHIMCICFLSTKECKKYLCKSQETNHNHNEKPAKKIGKARQHSADKTFPFEDIW